MAPFDRSHRTSYSHSTETLVLACTVSDIACYGSGKKDLVSRKWIHF